MFQPLPSKVDFPQAEKHALEYWEQHEIFARSIARRAGRPRFVFYEGPPTANGMPHPGHALTRVMKDVFPRYRAMCGYLVERKGGWDTHGLPVEREVEKELGLQGKEGIESYGVERFILKCINSVWRYTREWEELTRRLGYWVDLKNAYATYHQSYVESVWWGLKTLFDHKDASGRPNPLLYQAHKVVWWWAQGGTALSSGEVGEGYKTVDDPSVFVKFPLLSDERHHALLRGLGAGHPAAPRVSLLVWTTTPWTLLSNHFAAVHPELEYALVEDQAHEGGEPEYLVIAAKLVESISKKVKRELQPRLRCRGADLLGARYVPPFPEVYYGRAPQDMLGLPTCVGIWDAGDILGDSSAFRRDGKSEPVGWRVLAADFVSTESGSGLVHEAPAFGEVDYNLLQQERERFENRGAIPLLCAVKPDGTFNDDAPAHYRGRWVKDCDRDIIRELKERLTPWGTPLLFHQEQIRHEYPFCPRAENDPLIQYARKGWFVRTSQFKEEFLRNNAGIDWLPDHIKEGRFGDFLRNNVDWALSRERYWGTPLPIWVCEKCGRMEAVGSFAELRGRPGASDATPEHPGGFWQAKLAEHHADGEELPDDLRVHKPYIDAWTYRCSTPIGTSDSTCGGTMRRVPEVIDCWWDAGSMPFAQWGYPHAPGSIELFQERFPADFISEAIDQTRGWFYALLAINTLLFADRARQPALRQGGPKAVSGDFPLPFRACIVLGHIAGEDGLKMSKRLRNYREPTYIFDAYGADAMRWYFLSAQSPWTSVRFQEAAIRDSQREFLVKLYNVLSFFSIYASIDGFVVRPTDGRAAAAATGERPARERSELDRWAISELHRVIHEVREAMDRFENYPAAQRLNNFVDALSNWYVRRSRERFWRAVCGDGAGDQDKWDAYNTLHECLLTLSRLIAPFTPFFAELMFQSLRGAAAWKVDPADPTSLSVHLCDYPVADAALVDADLVAEMELVREIVSLGRAARTDAKIKVRQPLALVEIILALHEHETWLRQHAPLIAEELNVKRVEFSTDADHYVSYQVKANFKALGAKYRQLAPKIAKALESLPDPAAARRDLLERGRLPLEVDGQMVELTSEEVEVRLTARPGWSAAQGRAGVVVLNTELTGALRDEGVVREFIHYVQAARKDQDMPYQARVTLHVDGPTELVSVLEKFEPFIASECLAAALAFGPIPDAQLSQQIEVEGHSARLSVRAG